MELRALRYCGSTFCYTAISILLNYSMNLSFQSEFGLKSFSVTPPNAVGYANGVAQSIVSLARCVGPSLGGYVRFTSWTAFHWLIDSFMGCNRFGLSVSWTTLLDTLLASSHAEYFVPSRYCRLSWSAEELYESRVPEFKLNMWTCTSRHVFVQLECLIVYPVLFYLIVLFVVVFISLSLLFLFLSVGVSFSWTLMPFAQDTVSR